VRRPANIALERSGQACLTVRMRLSPWALAVAILSAAFAACSTSANSTSAAPSAVANDAGAEDAVAHSTEHAAPEELKRCAEVQRDLASVEDAIARLNELIPADGPCFVAALPRPLAVTATIGVLSAQPADGTVSPRLFFLLPKIVVSAVPSGKGSGLIEFGEWAGEMRTLKGEVALPVNSPLALDAAFARVMSTSGESTVCGSCHRDEERHPTVANGFISAAFRTEPGQGRTLAELSEMHQECIRTNDPSARCSMFHAVFDFGEVVQGAFDSKLETFLIH